MPHPQPSWFLSFILLAGLCLAGNVNADPVYLVELADFACPHCHHMEGYQSQIETAIAKTNGIFDFAPVMAEKQSDASAKVYFASRSQGPKIARETEALLFTAMATDGLPVQNVTQAIVFLEQDWPGNMVQPNWQNLEKASDGPAAVAAAKKAMALGSSLGVSKLPAFVFIRDGKPIGVLERGTRYPTMPVLFRAVIQAINLYQKGT
jgi:hypothetical protein